MKVTGVIPEYEIVAPKEAIVAWKHNAVTKQVMDIIRQEQENSRKRAVSPEVLGDNVVQQVARAIGYVEGLEFLTDTIMEVTNVIEDKEDDNDGKTHTVTIRQLCNC